MSGLLTAASARLRGKPGRPRRVESGQNAGITGAELRMKSGAEGRALVQPTSGPRLMDLHATAAYLGLSEWTVRDLEASGVLRRVRVPLSGGGELRKLLFDRADLDRLIETWKELA